MPVWTDAQNKAIDARNDAVLVSAAAGSGKTSVLVERVMRMLAGGMDIDRMLIITFTRAAAAELRVRLFDRIEAEAGASAHMRRQALRVERANISTLHTFCLRVLGMHFQAAGVDPLVHVGEEPALAAMSRRATDEAMEELCARAQAADGPGPASLENTDSAELTACFSDAEILEMCGTLYKFLMALDDPWEWLDRQAAAIDAAALDDHAWTRLLRNECLLLLRGARQLSDRCSELLSAPRVPAKFAAVQEADASVIDLMLEEVTSGRNAFGKVAFSRMPPFRPKPGEYTTAAEQFITLRKVIKMRVQEAADTLPGDSAAAARDIAHTLPAVRALSGLVRDMHSRYALYKEERGVLDYHDLEHKALLALSDARVRGDVAKQYSAVFVDEYQDISAIQEAVIQAVHLGNTLFMVGDVKQSIYRFRQADPTLFLKKYDTFSQAEEARERRILLTDNFRSRRNILDAVNLIFSNAMRRDVTEIAYDRDAMLSGGGQSAGDPPVSLHIISKDGETGEDRGQLSGGYLYEARLAARIIAGLVGQPLRGRDGVEHPLKYRDMVILLRNVSGRAPMIAQALTDSGIPVYSDADDQYFNLPEIADMLNIMRVLDNPLQDTALLSALRCPCFGFTSEELARVRIAHKEKDSYFYTAFFALDGKDAHVSDTACTLKKWRYMAQHIPMEDFVRLLLAETGLFSRAGALPGGELRQANLLLLCERAQSETAREGLHAFLKEADKSRVSDDTRSAKTLGEGEDVVRVMTLHKSKGLEFPVVILMEMARAFKTPSENEPLLADREAGLALRYVDSVRRVAHRTVAGRALACKKAREQRAEEARLLYVGMTRARERLYLLGSPRYPAAAAGRWALPPGDYAAGSAESMLDWVGQGIWPGLASRKDNVFKADNGSVWDIAWHDASEFDLAFKVPPAAVMPDIQGEPREDVARALAYKPVHTYHTIKTSVTAIGKKGPRTREDEEETAEDKRRNKLLNIAPRRCPEYLAGEDIRAVDRGVATHKALCALPLAAVRGLSGSGLLQAVEDALEIMEKDKVLLPEQKVAVRADWLCAFLTSSAGKRLLAASVVKREWGFVLRNEGSVIQGVIDCCFMEYGEWVLMDYKTDRLSLNEIKERYQTQMSWYARALQAITGARVKDAMLIALRTGGEITVPAI
jgi:ATP-dependent helicase/nuclease subunit A